jgi:hypothetical protein
MKWFADSSKRSDYALFALLLIYSPFAYVIENPRNVGITSFDDPWLLVSRILAGVSALAFLWILTWQGIHFGRREGFKWRYLIQSILCIALGVAALPLGIYSYDSNEKWIRSMGEIYTPMEPERLLRLKDVIDDSKLSLKHRSAASRIVATEMFRRTGQLTDVIDLDGQRKRYEPSAGEVWIRDNGKTALESSRKRALIDLLMSLAVILVVASAVVVGLRRRDAQ